MKQNIYDNESFFNQYEQMRSEEKEKNANDLIEIPNFRSLMPDVKEKSILDLGCGAGESDIYFKSLGAKYVLGTDISENMIKSFLEYKIFESSVKILSKSIFSILLFSF
jgi:SAM-dependent methyltransferase